MELAFFSTDGWTGWDLERKPAVPDGMPVLVDGDLLFEDGLFLSDSGMLFFFPLVTPASWRLLVMRPKNDQPPPGASIGLHEVQTLCDAYTAHIHSPAGPKA